MTHDAFAEKLLDLAYGELSPREARKVESHAAGCEACRAELSRIRETRSLMARLPEEPAPEKGERILFAAAREAAVRRAPSRRRGPRWLLAGAVVAASLVAVGAVSFRIASMGARPPSERPDSEALLGGSFAKDEVPRSLPPTPEANPAGAGAARAPEPEAAARHRALEAEVKRLRKAREEQAALPFAVPPPRAADGGRAAGTDLDAPSAAAGAEERADTAGRQAAAGPAAAPPSPQPAEPQRAEARPAEPQRPRVESEALGVRRGAPAAKSAQAPAAGPTAAASPSVASRPRGATREFQGCEGESYREVHADERGRVGMYVREGRFAGRRVRVIHVYAPDGSLRSATAQDLDAGGPPVDPRTLGVEPVRRAEDAGIDAPPRCGP